MGTDLKMGSYASLSDQNVLVTGSTKGIGLAVARAFHGAGAMVVLHGRADTPVDGLIENFLEPQRVRYVGGDLCDRAARREVMQAAGHLDHLVNKPAIQLFDALLQFAQCAENSSGSSIVNIASTRAVRPGVGLVSYSASKAAVVSLTQSAAAELGSRGVRVSAISPGLIEGPNLRKDWPEGVSAFENSGPLGRIGQPEDIAAACLFLSSASAAWITGQNIVIDGGITLVR